MFQLKWLSKSIPLKKVTCSITLFRFNIIRFHYLGFIQHGSSALVVLLFILQLIQLYEWIQETVIDKDVRNSRSSLIAGWLKTFHPREVDIEFD